MRDRNIILPQVLRSIAYAPLLPDCRPGMALLWIGAAQALIPVLHWPPHGASAALFDRRGRRKGWRFPVRHRLRQPKQRVFAAESARGSDSRRDAGSFTNSANSALMPRVTAVATSLSKGRRVRGKREEGRGNREQGATGRRGEGGEGRWLRKPRKLQNLVERRFQDRRRRVLVRHFAFQGRI